MKVKGVAAVLLVITSVVIVLCLSSRRKVATQFISTNFAFDAGSFYKAVNNPQTISPTSQVLVLPHHLTASSMIASGISSIIKNSSPRTIVILSPNHSDKGNCDIVTTDKSWSTPFGPLYVDQVLLSKLSPSHSFCYDDQVFSSEHGVAGLLPFVAYYSDKVRIIPFAFKKFPDPNNLNLFVNSLQSIKDPGIIILSSIDFSHYLPLEKALLKDEETLALIKSKKFEQISTLTSDNVDSPSSLIVAMRISEDLGSPLEVVDHQNSSVFNHYSGSVTTYFLLSGRSPSPSWEASRAIPSLTTDRTSSTVSLFFVGDIMLGRTVNTQMLHFQDFTWPFQNVGDKLAESDLTVANLESPFRSGCSATDSGMIFCSDPRSISGLTFAGIDIVNLANNHILNQGQSGLTETINILKDAHIYPLGLGKPVYINIKDTLFAFLGANDVGVYPSIASASSPSFLQEIKSARSKANFVVVTVHWGNEYQSRSSSRQQTLAHQYIDAGADIVIGHHPHWVQESEVYKSKVIYYSLGNFIFDQMWSESTKNGLGVQFLIQDSQIVGRNEYQVHIDSFGQANFR